MTTFKKFLCDWGSPDSNMLLFFLLTAFLLGIFTGWLIWGRKIQAILAQIAARDLTINDINTKLTAKEADLAKTNQSNQELIAKNRGLSEEKGQLYAELSTAREEGSEMRASLASRMNLDTDTIPAVVAVASVAPTVDLPTADLPDITIDDDTDAAIKNNQEDAIEDLPIADIDDPSLVDTLVAEIEEENETVPEPEYKVEVPNTIEDIIVPTQTVDIDHIDEVTTDSVEGNDTQADEPIELAVSTPDAPDDLKIVEGIGPKIEALLNDAGISTFGQLANTDTERLREILEAAGRRYQMHDPRTWVAQANMAAEGKWEELKTWQETLKGGK